MGRHRSEWRFLYGHFETFWFLHFNHCLKLSSKLTKSSSRKMTRDPCQVPYLEWHLSPTYYMTYLKWLDSILSKKKGKKNQRKKEKKKEKIRKEIYTHICVYIYLYTYACMYMHMYVYIYMYTYMCMYIYVYVYIYVYIYIYTHTSTYAHICTDTRSYMSLWNRII